MAAIFTLTDDAFLYIMQYLDTKDRIAFANTCQKLRQICVNVGAFRKVDLSKYLLPRTQRGAICKFLRDQQVAQHIRELNLSNSRVLNWQIDDQLEEFIISFSPHLEALHVLDCGMSLQRLDHILKQAPKLKSLSWSLRDFTTEDIEFLANRIKSSDGICLKNIKYLHLDTFPSKPHIQIVKYLVLSCCKCLEELEIYSWQIFEEYCTRRSFTLSPYEAIFNHPQPSTSIADVLQYLHSLTVLSVGAPSYSFTLPQFSVGYEAELSDFVFSVVRKKSRQTVWKKFWISPPIGIECRRDMPHFTDSSLPLHEIHPHELRSVKAFAAHVGHAQNTVNDFKTWFQRIDDNSVRSLHLCQPASQANSILELCEPISRVAGHALKFLSLNTCSSTECEIKVQQNIALHTLFSNCSNVTELDLLGCYFEKDICTPLSKLKHLTKVQLMLCAISSKHLTINSRVKMWNANLLTFVENCQNITHFDVCGCRFHHKHFTCYLRDADLQAFAKIRNLRSLTLYEIFDIKKWAFLQTISENCKYLTMLRISVMQGLKSCILHVMECAKFLKHLAINIPKLGLGSKRIWNLLSQATNLERLCIRSDDEASPNMSGVAEMLKCLPRLHVLHLHSPCARTVFHNKMLRILEEEESDRRLFFELITQGLEDFAFDFSKPLISKKAHPLNIAELCYMSPILIIPRLSNRRHVQLNSVI